MTRRCLRPTLAERLELISALAGYVVCAVFGATLGIAAWWSTLCLICLETVQ